MSLTRGCVAGSQLRWTQVDLVRHWLDLVKPKTMKTTVKDVMVVALVCATFTTYCAWNSLNPSEEDKACQRMYRCLSYCTDQPRDDLWI